MFSASASFALDFNKDPMAGFKAAMENNGNEAPAASDPAADRAALPEWTVMVFINGKNDLANFGDSDVNEMEVVGSTAKMNVVVELGMLKKGVKRYFVTKDKNEFDLSSPVVQDLGSPDMGDWKHLVDFANWAKAAYPAKRYMLVIWNHGSGWVSTKGISYDDETRNHISTPELGLAMKAIGKVDILSMDACLMQMAEVAYELKDTARITVGSEENEPGDGWGYNEFLSRVHSNQAGLTPDVMAAAAVQGYKAFYAPKGTATTQSAIRTSGLAKYRQLLDQWAELAMKEDKAVLTAARDAAVGFGGAGSKDLTNFMELVHARTQNAALKAKTAETMKHFYDKVLIDNGTTGAKFEKAYGLGVYLPGYSFDADYSELAWSREGKWDEFMQWLTAK